MTSTTPRQTVYPVLRYADCDGALRFLTEAFGLGEHAVHRDDGGQIVHAELTWGPDLVMFGARREGTPFPDGPTLLYLVADDVDALCERAVAAGAEVAMPPTDQDYGSRDVALRDPEGNVWSFGTYGPERPAG